MSVETLTPRPVWIRMPKGRCPHTSLTRAKLYQLIRPADGKKPLVRNLILADGNQRGCRMIHLQSLLDYLDEQATAQEGAQ
jgi:hypothetical protein